MLTGDVFPGVIHHDRAVHSGKPLFDSLWPAVRRLSDIF
jgi:hypothetical protein